MIELRRWYLKYHHMVPELHPGPARVRSWPYLQGPAAPEYNLKEIEGNDAFPEYSSKGRTIAATQMARYCITLH